MHKSNKNYVNIEYNSKWQKSTSNRRSANIENGGFKMKKTKVYTSDIESSPWKVKRAKKSPSNRKLFRATKYKEPKKNKGEPGLWSPEVQDWHKKSKAPKTKKKKQKVQKKGKGIKKLDNN